MSLLSRSFGRFSVSTLRRAFTTFRPLRGQARAVVRASLLAIAVTGLELLKPWPLKFVFDQVLVSAGGRSDLWGLSDIQFVGVAAVATVAIAVGIGALSLRAAVATAEVGRRGTTRIRRQVFEHLHRLALPFHQSSRTGDLVSRLMRDVSMLRELIFDSWVALLDRGVLFVGTAVVILLIDPWFALLALLPVPFLGVGVGRSSRRLKDVVRKQRRREGHTAALAAETLRQIRVVKAYAAEEIATERFVAHSRVGEKAEVRTARITAEMNRLTEILTGVGAALVLFVGAWRVLAEFITPGELLVLLSYARSLYRPVRRISRQGGRLSKASACAERILEIMSVPPEKPGVGAPAPSFAGKIAFESVHYAYPDGHEALRGLTFGVKQGSLSVLAGPNGCGKSTAIAVLLRLVAPQEGVVLVDGEPIDGFQLESYRRQFAYVPQEIQLFAGTIRENILYGRPDATDEEVEEAARACLMHDVAARLPEGYETTIGENGGTLSGGEARRLMLARATLRDARILLLDEPFAGLDGPSRAVVARTIRRIADGRSTLIVSHGPAEESDPDVVLHLAEGRLASEERRRYPALGVAREERARPIWAEGYGSGM